MRSFVPGAHPGAPLMLKRLVFLLFLFPLFLILQWVHWLGHFLDEWWFRGYRHVDLAGSVWITGIPRSGTTYVHRTLAANRRDFSTVSSWEAVLAPSVAEKKLLRFFRSLLGPGWGETMAGWVHRCCGEFQGVHEVDPRLPEEDYLLMLASGGCFLMALAFPFEERFWKLANLEEMDAESRERHLRFYRACLQKHLYVFGEGRVLLSKNAAFGSWLPSLKAMGPSARFIICVRDPAEALRSQLTSIEAARDLFGTDPDGGLMAERFAEIYRKNYQRLAERVGRGRDRSDVVIEMEELRARPGEVFRGCCGILGIEIDGGLAEQIREAEEREVKPPKRHEREEERWGFDKSQIDAWMAESYRTVRAAAGAGSDRR